MGSGKSFEIGVLIMALPIAIYSPNFHPWQFQKAGVLNTKAD